MWTLNGKGMGLRGTERESDELNAIGETQLQREGRMGGWPAVVDKESYRATAATTVAQQQHYQRYLTLK